MMVRNAAMLGLTTTSEFTAVAIPYMDGELQLLVVLPNEVDGLGKLEAQMSAKMLGELATMKQRAVELHLPKFKFEPPTVPLATQLKALGMKSAFDEPPGSANFDRMAPRQAGATLAISEVFHKTFIAVDENGTEAAAATAVGMVATSAPGPVTEPTIVKIDRPFFYAIQHVPSGACLFIGRVLDPR